MIAEDYKERLKKLAKEMFSSNEKIAEAAIEYATAKAVRVISGRHFSDPLTKEYWEKYPSDIANAGMEVYNEDKYRDYE